MAEAKGAPLSLSDIVGTTVEGGTYGKHSYSNLGYDLAAMIIEVMTGKDFDKVVKETILIPNGLRDIYLQSELQDLYKTEGLDVAEGFFEDLARGEMDFNRSNNTRGAGVNKAKASDLARLGALYMTGEMFKSVEVKAQLQDRGTKDYHLAIRDNKDGTFGHNGTEPTVNTDLRYNPETEETTVTFHVVENLTHRVVAQIIENLYSEDRAKEFDNGDKAIGDSQFYPTWRKAERPPRGEEVYNQLASDHLQKNPELNQLLSVYADIRESVMKHDFQTLKANRDEIVESITDTHREKLVEQKSPDQSPSQEGGAAAKKPKTSVTANADATKQLTVATVKSAELEGGGSPAL